MVPRELPTLSPLRECATQESYPLSSLSTVTLVSPMYSPHLEMIYENTPMGAPYTSFAPHSHTITVDASIPFSVEYLC